MFAPFTQEAPADARNNATGATSCGVPMRADGERLVAEGVTSLEEVVRVTRE